jgi:hypothetical protein
MCCLVSWECSVVSYYQNKDIILTTENEKYNFIFMASIMNIFNILFLLFVFFDKNIKLVYFGLLLILNLIIGLWNCTIYNNIKLYGLFNDIIIFEFNIFLIKFISLFVGLLYTLIVYIIIKNDTIYEDYEENLIIN